MGFVTVRKGALEYLTAENLSGTIHGFSTRYGGVSQGYLSSLNLGTHRGDEPQNVLQNYKIFGEALGFSPEDLVFAVQKHTDIVEKVGRRNRGEGLFREVTEARDGLVTNEPGVALTIFSADCTPILFYDPVARAIGGCHAGWRGTASGIGKNVVELMCREYGSRPQDIRAAIGPCIGSCCFETHSDVPEAMTAALGPQAKDYITPKGETFLVDLKGINALWLRRAGVCQIEISPDCTCCQNERFWSHRATGGERGSLANVIMLK